MPPRPVTRNLGTLARDRAQRYPTLTITGPRQSGKTTLCRLAFPAHTYVNLEDPATREHAEADPRGFLRRLDRGAIIDEAQRVPSLFSALQVIVDEDRTNGRFVLSGSHDFRLHEAISQSLAGRTSVLELLPPALDELRRFPGAPADLWETLVQGAYPRILDQHIPAAEFLADYVRTYVERDVRLVLNVRDLGAFQTFLRLCAGRSGSVVNLAALAADCGITHPTAKAWLGVLEASYIVRRIQPWFRNVGKRLVKAPKLHFLDSGLLCWLLGVTSPEQLGPHPLRGMVFESWVTSEVLKARANRGVIEPLWYYRDQGGAEADLVVELPGRRVLVDAKSGARVAADSRNALDRVARILAGDRSFAGDLERVIAYGGDDRVTIDGIELLPWGELPAFAW